MKKFNNILLVTCLIVSGNFFAKESARAADSTVLMQESVEVIENNDEKNDGWENVVAKPERKSWYKRASFKRDVLVIGTVVMSYAVSIYMKKLPSPVVMMNEAYSKINAIFADHMLDASVPGERRQVDMGEGSSTPVLSAKDQELLKAQECCICCEPDQACIKYCDWCSLSNFICLSCINKMVKKAPWKFVENVNVKELKCPLCRSLLNRCYDQESAKKYTKQEHID